MFPQKCRALGVTALITSIGLVACSNEARQTLNVGAIPDQNPEKLNRLYKLLSSELNRELNVPIRYKPVTNYAAAVSAFRTGSLDLVWFGGLTGVQARLQKPGAQVLAQRDFDANFHSVFIANKASRLGQIKNINGLKILQGKRFTFGSESSTSGRLMPQYFLYQAGVELNDFAGQHPGFSGSHDATIALVQSNSFEAGALNEKVWISAIKNGRADPKKVKVIWRSPPYADYHWLAQPNLDHRFGSGFTLRLQNALLNLNNQSSRQRKILALFGASRFIPASIDQYSKIEKVGRELGKIQ
ncbi:MAG: putative selenate ABC transporter substrate-binding protein [Prochlorococcus sp.]